MDFLLAHGFEVAQLGVNLILMLWAVAKKADKALLVYLKSELSSTFLTKADGHRIEHKLDRLLRRYRINASKRRAVQDSGNSLQAD